MSIDAGLFVDLNQISETGNFDQNEQYQERKFDLQRSLLVQDRYHIPEDEPERAHETHEALRV